MKPRAVTVLVGLVGLGAMLLWWCCGSGAAAPPDRPANRRPDPAAEPAVATADAAAAELTEADGANPARAQRAALPEPGVFGLVVDGAGEPIAGIGVRLLADGRPERERRIATTGADGTFAYPQLPSAAYELGIFNHLPATQRFVLAAGERRDVRLQFEGRCTLLEGVLLRNGVPVGGRHVRVRGHDQDGHVEHTDVTDAHGAFRHLLRPGDYRLLVEGAPVEFPARGQLGRSYFGRAPGLEAVDLAVPLHDPPARVRRDLAIPATRIAVRVLDDAGRPVADARAHLQWNRRDGGSLRTGDDGTLAFTELPLGSGEVRVGAVHHPDAEPQLVTLAAGALTADLTFTLAAGGGLAVEALDPDGNELHSGGQEPLFEVRTADGARHAGESEVVGHGFGRGSRFRFDHLPVGPAELVIADVEEVAGVRFAAADPLRLPVVVAAGTTTDVALRGVRLRAWGHFRVLDARGEPAAGVAIAVRMVGGPVVVGRGAETGWQWSGPLAPGDYEVTASWDGGRSSERVHVDREDVRHSFAR